VFFGTLSQSPFHRAEQHDGVLQLGRKVAYCVAPHHLGESHQLQIADVAVRAITVFECEPIAGRNWAVALLPHSVVEKGPYIFVPAFLALVRALSHLDVKETFRIGLDRTDRFPLCLRCARHLAFLELRLTHPSCGPAGPALALVHRHIALREAVQTAAFTEPGVDLLSHLLHPLS
jgi:hypothetical protein